MLVILEKADFELRLRRCGNKDAERLLTPSPAGSLIPGRTTYRNDDPGLIEEISSASRYGFRLRNLKMVGQSPAYPQFMLGIVKHSQLNISAARKGMPLPYFQGIGDS